MPLQMTPWKLVTSVANRWVVGRLAKQAFNIGSGNRDILTTNPESGLVEPWEPMLSRNMVDANRWFLISKEHDMRFYVKEDFAMESADDFYTGAALFKCIGRFGCFAMDYKGVFGNPGS